MSENEHGNSRRILIIIVIVVVIAILIGVLIGRSLLKQITNKNIKSKDLASSEVKNKVTEENAVTTDENITDIEKEDSSEKNEIKKDEEIANLQGGYKHRLPALNPNAVQLCKEAQSGDEKNIYLTFDDGPSPSVTPRILETLKEQNVPATFFVLGSRAELYPDLIKKEFEEGHYIANHGYSHSYSSIYSSVQAVLDEYNKTESAIQTALGIPEFHSYLFRFPGGSSGGPYNSLKQEAKSTLEGMGIASTNWNCLSGDAEGNGKKSVEELQNRLYETAKGWNSLVVLMHDADDKKTTADALPSIIEHYKNAGYTFKNYYDIFQ